MKTIVDIKRIIYTDLITTVPFSGAAVKAILTGTSFKEITNVHATTWAYEEQEGSVTDYINQLNGQTYYRDSEPGSRSINFTIGQYDYETKAELQGGTATATTWVAPKNQGIIYKSVIAVTKDDTYIVMPKAQIEKVDENPVKRRRAKRDEMRIASASEYFVLEKADWFDGSGVWDDRFKATPLDTGIAGLASEYRFDKKEVAYGK